MAFCGVVIYVRVVEGQTGDVEEVVAESGRARDHGGVEGEGVGDGVEEAEG